VVRVQTSPEQAVKDTPGFIAAAQEQTGRAWVEVEEKDAWRNLGKMALNYATSMLTDPMSLMALLGGGGAGLLAMGLKLYKTYKDLTKTREAVVDAVKGGDALAKVDPKDAKALADAKKDLAAKQKARGTKGIIEAALENAKKST